MQFADDTPQPGQVPKIYPSQPPINLLRDLALLSPKNLFAFEGVDGSGKSTLIRAIVKILQTRQIATTVKKLAGSQLVHHALERAKWLNVDPMCFNLLNWVSVFQQVAELQYLLNTDHLVMFDRYTMSVRIRGMLEGLEADFMDIFEKMVPRPTVLFIVDCPISACCDRIRQPTRQVSYFESGVRHVSGPGVPMHERGEWERKPNTFREEQLANALLRFRNQYGRMASHYSNVVIIDNSNSLEHAVDSVLRHIPQWLDYTPHDAGELRQVT